MKGKNIFLCFYQTLNCTHDVKFVKQTINKKWGGKSVSDLTYKKDKRNLFEVGCLFSDLHLYF